MNVEIIIYYNIFIVYAGRGAKRHIVTYRGLQSRRMVITIRFSPPAGMVPAPRGSYPHGAGIPNNGVIIYTLFCILQLCYCCIYASGPVDHPTISHEEDALEPSNKHVHSEPTFDILYRKGGRQKPWTQNEVTTGTEHFDNHASGHQIHIG